MKKSIPISPVVFVLLLLSAFGAGVLFCHGVEEGLHYVLRGPAQWAVVTEDYLIDGHGNCTRSPWGGFKAGTPVRVRVSRAPSAAGKS